MRPPRLCEAISRAAASARTSAARSSGPGSTTNVSAYRLGSFASIRPLVLRIITDASSSLSAPTSFTLSGPMKRRRNCASVPSVPGRRSVTTL